MATDSVVNSVVLAQCIAPAEEPDVDETNVNKGKCPSDLQWKKKRYAAFAIRRIPWLPSKGTVCQIRVKHTKLN